MIFCYLKDGDVNNLRDRFGECWTLWNQLTWSWWFKYSGKWYCIHSACNSQHFEGS